MNICHKLDLINRIRMFVINQRQTIHLKRLLIKYPNLIKILKLKNLQIAFSLLKTPLIHQINVFLLHKTHIEIRNLKNKTKLS